MNNDKLRSRLDSKLQTLNKSYDITADKTLPQQDLSYLAFNDNVMSIIKENLKRNLLSLQFFDVVKSPSGGATVFSVPGLSGDEAEKEIVGIVLDYTTPRAYWDTPDPIEGTPPVCFSYDSVISHDGKSCAACPYNDYGSKDGESNAKACKESALLLLLRPNNILPLLVRVQVTSKPRFLKYVTRLIGNLTPINAVVTRVTLEKATSKTGKPYALFNFEAAAALCDSDAAKAKMFGQQFMEMINSADAVNELAKAG